MASVGSCRGARNLSLVEGHDVIVVQTKARQLGMNLFGQALGSRELIQRRFTPNRFARSPYAPAMTPSFAR
jgi:hypothetical protein